MITILQEILLDFQDLELFSGIPRRLDVTPVQGKATVCIGVRRSGKSTFMSQLIQKLLDSGVSRQNILYLNFFDDRLHGLQQSGLGVILDAYYALYPAKKNSEKVYCFFDEIQAIEGWEPFVDRLMRTENCEVYITGSSARMLSKEIATQMRGRALSWEVFPFSFREYLDYLRVDAGDGLLSTKQRLFVQNAFEQYWAAGGFPEVAGLERRLRIKIHQEYFHAVLFRDLVERHNISHPKAVTDLAHWLIDNTASLYSLNKLTGYLKSLGHKAPQSAVADYLEWFEDAYFLFTVRLFDASLSRANANPKKIYCIDHAMVTSVASGILVNAGHLLENLVFITLRRLTPAIFYYKTKGGREVDFIAQWQDHPRLLVQVCESLASPTTRKREIAALEEAMVELNLPRGIIVTRHEEERIVLDAGIIDVIPAWRFLLYNPPFCTKQ
ncbi:ATP-binding protein [Thiothrix winogradskyi]|uniref:ATP-binding protein n=1 Tax=Thiothrix winogradskyi TaxID=96472 RepID=A0ABY3SVH3_9GAMM|nr:ATP-binding protein [Thiothrix winogradskyi]UJS23134.1 ATP-binding protein [Thiothrix winogradskyi]